MKNLEVSTISNRKPFIQSEAHKSGKIGSYVIHKEAPAMRINISSFYELDPHSIDTLKHSSYYLFLAIRLGKESKKTK